MRDPIDVRIDRKEISLYTHPALLLPPALNDEWTAEKIAAAFDDEFKDRLVGCGVLGMESLPVDLKSEFHARAKQTA